MPGSVPLGHHFVRAAVCALPGLCLLPSAAAQIFIVQPEHIEQHYSKVDPTSVKLSSEPLTTVGREQLYRFMQSEQGFAMRPLPVGNVSLQANGPMDPGGEKYIDELHAKGISAKPGDRVVVTDLKVRDNTIVLDLNNGPEHKHKYLRHISIGMDPAYTNPVVADDGTPPTGSRVTLVFPGRVPDLSGEQLESLLKPMIDFGVKSPAEAYAESLPPFLGKAIKEHRVLIGMDRDMVLYAKGQPARKVREQDSTGKSFEVWIYGEAPEPVEFVRFDGNVVVRTELAKVGEPLVVQTANQMGGYWDNQPAVAANQHEVELGDRTAADVSDENAPKSPPTLRQPGEKLPTDGDKDHPVMAPVNMPPGMSRPGDPGYTPTVSAPPQTGSGSSQPAASGSAPPSSAGSGQPASSGSGQQTTSSNTQKSTAGASQPASGSGSSAPAPPQQPASTPPASTPAPQ
jgi:hypothetical protein